MPGVPPPFGENLVQCAWGRDPLGPPKYASPRIWRGGLTATYRLMYFVEIDTISIKNRDGFPSLTLHFRKNPKMIFSMPLRQ